MSQWHREFPHLVGGSEDPWFQHASYRKALVGAEFDCPECGDFARITAEGVCVNCAQGDAA